MLYGAIRQPDIVYHINWELDTFVERIEAKPKQSHELIISTLSRFLIPLNP